MLFLSNFLEFEQPILETKDKLFFLNDPMVLTLNMCLQRMLKNDGCFPSEGWNWKTHWSA